MSNDPRKWAKEHRTEWWHAYPNGFDEPAICGEGPTVGAPCAWWFPGERICPDCERKVASDTTVAPGFHAGEIEGFIITEGDKVIDSGGIFKQDDTEDFVDVDPFSPVSDFRPAKRTDDNT